MVLILKPVHLNYGDMKAKEDAKGEVCSSSMHAQAQII